MKKIVLTLIALFCLASCDEMVNKEPYTDSNGITHETIKGSTFDDSIEKITIEGHEYLKFTAPVYAGHSVAVVHSASCPANHEDWNRP